jgi:hypothetical protein
MKINITKEEFEQIVKECFSTSQVLSRMGLAPIGGNYRVFKKRVQTWGTDTSHFTGQGWCKGKKGTRVLTPLDKVLQKDSFYNSHKLRRRLITEGLKEHKCEGCGHTEWRGEPIPLELEHRNGDNTDNQIENLLVLCPNCHAMTEHYRGRSKVKSKKNEIRRRKCLEEHERMREEHERIQEEREFLEK